MKLSEGQTFLINVVAAPILVQVFKLLALKLGTELSRRWITIIGFIVSIALGYWWAAPQFTPSEDPMQFATALLTAASTVFGVATLAYNLLMDKVFELLSVSKDKVLAKLNGG